MKGTSSITPLIVVVLFAIMGYMTFQDRCDSGQKSRTSPTEDASPTPAVMETPGRIEVGSELYLKGNSATAPVAVDKDSFYEFEKALSAKDYIGLNKLTQGQVMIVNNGTKVLVIDRDGYGALKVRILEGKYTGRAGWTDPNWTAKEK
jgi:hypothetical protein